jgi:hypothetical protein
MMAGAQEYILIRISSQSDFLCPSFLFFRLIIEVFELKRARLAGNRSVYSRVFRKSSI